jgi:hypothetical protein
MPYPGLFQFPIKEICRVIDALNCYLCIRVARLSTRIEYGECVGLVWVHGC